MEESPLPVDVALVADDDPGSAAAAWMRQQTAAWPALRPLCLVVKVLLRQRTLGDTSLGGLGSYTLVNLLVHSLQSSRLNG